MNIIGISALYHDSACCLIKDGKLIAAAQEERFSRIKNDPGFPIQALRYCMKQGNLLITDIDCIAYYEQPAEKLRRQVSAGQTEQQDSQYDRRFDHRQPMIEISEMFGYEGPVRFYWHHQSHAASSFFFSGFNEAAVMTVDGVGEWSTTTYGTGNQHGLREIHSIDFPHSVGLLYSSITNYLGFEVNEGEYKVMGLAPYGTGKFINEFETLLHDMGGFDFQLDTKYFDFSAGPRMFTQELCDLFGRDPRKKGDPLEPFHMDVAHSLQKTLEQFMISKTSFLKKETGLNDLCLSGGVALNCVANRAVQQSGRFKRVFVPPGSNDSGCAIGAAALASFELGDNPIHKLAHAYLGPAYTGDEIETLLDGAGMVYEDYRGKYNELLNFTAKLIAEGKVVGWFHGRMEFGPRALGARSILADPRQPGHRDLINSMVKKREGFRPFAPTVIEERASDFFELDHASPFMLETCGVKPCHQLPAITHVDGTARPQTIDSLSNKRYYDLLKKFEELTGYPILLNTSFNVNKEPIVCSPVDALRCFLKSGIDALVIEDFVVQRSKNVIDELQVRIINDLDMKRGVLDSVYTFI